MKKELTATTALQRHSACGEILVALAALFLSVMVFTACTASDDEQQSQRPEQDQPIVFSVTTGSDTRATGEIDDEELKTLKDGEDKPYGFGVFASYTGQWRYTTTTVKPDFFCNQQVVCGETTDHTTIWTYSPLKYWPNGEGDATGEGMGEIAHQVSFFAYAPWSDLTSTTGPAVCITDCSRSYEPGDPWVLYRLAPSSAQQVDLLYAACDFDHYGLGDGLCNIDLTKPEVSQRVNFHFRHALGIVGDKVTVSTMSELQSALHAEVTGGITAISLVLTSIKIEYTLTSKARLMLFARDGEPNWQTVTSENVKATRTVSLDGIGHTLYAYNGTAPETIATYDDTAANPWTEKGLFYIPIEGDDYVQRARITIGYQVLRTGGTPYPSTGSATITKNVVLHEQEAYGPGKRMDFNITLGSTLPLTAE